jgi:hypothetical protein
MLVDGIGLALIAACTILEGIELWNDYFYEYWASNFPSLIFWFSGRTSQVAGLIFLLVHAASFQIFSEIEMYGMLLLTVGPILNLIACSLFDSGSDPFYLFNKQWLSSELIELLGISILDISLIEMEEHLFVLFFEVVGFFFLCCAAILDFEYFPPSDAPSGYPRVGLRLELVHSNECVGLLLLTVVAFGQYRIKLLKHQHGVASAHQTHGHNHTNTNTNTNQNLQQLEMGYHQTSNSNNSNQHHHHQQNHLHHLHSSADDSHIT